ncbi:hypothetical protein GJ688_12720 [Heliobacillus mobilis]|uniref:Uncharacterized protein n=1 Tax=Heliobacterium mobile TaxID=28064 RepID=A0A6I3SM71_HELMO|nr:hypothetical protein [Heliobacterium mobile]MTV49835.1 hypothetical protein [Heliobacterium mobile]
MAKPILAIPKSKGEEKAERVKAKIADYSSRKAKGEKPNLDTLAEKLDLIIDMLFKD